MTFIACLCNAEGSEDDWCNVGNGQCFCKDSIVGRQCDHCVEGFYGFPACVGMYVGVREDKGPKPGFLHFNTVEMNLIMKITSFKRLWMSCWWCYS